MSCGTYDGDTVYSGVAGSYSADALKWTVQYDHDAPLTTGEHTQQQVTTHHRAASCVMRTAETKCTVSCCADTCGAPQVALVRGT
jgi:hypothetical protein